MPVTPQRAAILANNLTVVKSRITNAAAATATTQTKNPIRLVAVSKLKPAADILSLHEQPTIKQLHFGENYVQELMEKSQLLPESINWHFIGGLQSNKCVALARDVKGLWAVESVDSEKKASLLDKGFGERLKRQNLKNQDSDDGRLRIFIQVNTSGEENKSGIDPSSTPILCRFILEKCPHLKLQGIMTIGAIARSKATAPGHENEDFLCLRDTRDRVVSELGLDSLELSMGMSDDFEGAISLGSDQVRVGTTIFGERPLKSEARVV